MGRTGMVVVLCLLSTAACKSDRREVVVFAAASLARAFSDLKEQLEKEQPKLEVRLTLSGSQEACRKIAELGHRADVVASADHRLIDTILRPAHARATIQFTTNEVVLAHGQHSKHTEEITPQNWPALLQRPGVRLGLADPELAPIGYATLLVWQLAELELAGMEPGLSARLRARCAPEHLASDEGELLQLLQTRAIDYAFMYRSTVEEHNLKLVPLPDSYNLGAVQQQAGYARAAVKVGTRPGDQVRELRGSPIIFGLTIPEGAPNPEGAALFVASLLGENGQRVLRRSGFRPLRPARSADRAALPESLRALTR